ncbi:MAG: CRISPR-associated endonuclease Cas3'' [Thermoanaerobaculia bacterium]|nr:CRISPR-associated endonuclease Cas3'' [Thermoanaerobaculia bacterium]
MTDESNLFYGHSATRPEHFELLRDHLEHVARRAANNASFWGAGTEAYAAGLLHDLGKYTELFQRRLCGLEKGLDHWTIGAVAAGELYRDDFWAVALAIHGHHVGLQRGSKQGLGVCCG